MVVVISLEKTIFLPKFAMTIEKDPFIEQEETAQATREFFQYGGNVSIIKSAIELLTQRNNTLEFISRVIDKYGYPLWDHTAYIHEEGINRTSLFVPFKNDLLDEVETIWIFRFYPNERRYTYRGVTRKKSVEDDEWTFDYFTQLVLKKRPKNGVVYKIANENEGNTRYIIHETACMTIECIDYYAGGEGYEVYKGSRCWASIKNGGGYVGASGGSSGSAPGDGSSGSGPSGGGNGSGDNGGGGGRGYGHEEVEPDLDGGGTYEPPPVPTITVLKVTKNIDLNTVQVQKLNKALDDFINEGCMQKALYNTLVNKNVKLDFGMKTGSAPGGYNPNAKRLSFNDVGNITKETLKEELFHAWQDAYYPGGTGQYGKDVQGNKLPGLVNIEFEAKVFKDISRNLDYGCCYIFGEDNVPSKIRNDYYTWVESIQNNPSLLLREDYGKWLDLFNQYYTDYSSPKNSNLSLPSSLDGLINMSNCF